MFVSSVGDCVGPGVISPTDSESTVGSDVLVMGICMGVDVGPELGEKVGFPEEESSDGEGTRDGTVVGVEVACERVGAGDSLFSEIPSSPAA